MKIKIENHFGIDLHFQINNNLTSINITLPPPPLS